MSRSRVLVPEAKAGLNKFKMEAAKETGTDPCALLRRQRACR